MENMGKVVKEPVDKVKFPDQTKNPNGNHPLAMYMNGDDIFLVINNKGLKNVKRWHVLKLSVKGERGGKLIRLMNRESFEKVVKKCSEIIEDEEVS